MASDDLPPIHPGELLKDELDALGMTAHGFAAHIRVPPNAVTAILNENRGITAEMACRLGHAFGTGAAYWMRLQDIYEEKLARRRVIVPANAVWDDFFDAPGIDFPDRE